MLCTCKNFGMTISAEDRELFSGLSFSLQRGECLAIAGANGCGKSSFAEYLYRQAAGMPHRSGLTVNGTLIFAKNISVAWLPQSATTEDDFIAGRDDYWQNLFFDGQFEFGRKPSEGQRQKLRIAATLRRNADFYIFDEPTNYLDFSGIAALDVAVDDLLAQGKSIVLISHDRSLIDNHADKTIYFTRNGIFSSAGGWSESFNLYQSTMEGKVREAATIKNKINQLKQDAERKKRWSERCESAKYGKGATDTNMRDRGAIGAQAARLMKRSLQQRKRIGEKIQELERCKPRPETVPNLSFPGYKVSNKTVSELRSVTFAYPDHAKLFDGLSCVLSTRDRVCFLGENGSGKSTLMKILTGHLMVDGGEARVSNAVNWFYIPQGLKSFWRDERSLLNNFIVAGINEAVVRRYLGAAGIWGEQVKKPLSAFSYGELMRAALVLCILSNAEFIFMDEPTSHLDVDTIMIMEKMLQEFSGGYALISHDQRFVENVADKLLFIKNAALEMA
ncbi:MAG: ATP-binding cassette domain-containing protein [Negativicutes bacterium]